MPRAARGEARNEVLRAQLQPLGPDERPRALVVAATLAAALSLANIAAFAAGVEVDGRRPSVVGVLLFCVLMGSAAWGMWQRRYWAVLGFEALLGISVALAALSALFASNPMALITCAAIVGLGGWLFWKLVRVMARLQAPERRPPDTVG